MQTVINADGTSHTFILGYIDPLTGNQGWVAGARIVKWINDNTAEVEYSCYHGPVAAFGGRGTIKYEDGKWVYYEKESWIS